MKFNLDSKFIIIEDEGLRPFKNPYTGEITNKRILRKTIATRDVNLGSIAKPNRKIREIQFEVPSKRRASFFRCFPI